MVTLPAGVMRTTFQDRANAVLFHGVEPCVLGKKSRLPCLNILKSSYSHAFFVMVEPLNPEPLNPWLRYFFFEHGVSTAVTCVLYFASCKITEHPPSGWFDEAPSKGAMLLESL